MPESPVRIVIAPDAFKGSLSSVEVAEAMAIGLRRTWPEAGLVLRPMADGGEGTIAALATAESGVEVTVAVEGPQGEPVSASWWHAADGTAVVEMATASGLSQTALRNPLTATSYGTGQLLDSALSSSAQRIWLCCGGSATVDGGAGMLTALGFELLDGSGRPLPRGGGALHRLAEIRPHKERLATPIEILHDVVNPLIGSDGAAAIYGPQKGANADAVEILEAGLFRLGQVLDDTFGKDPRKLVGGGAGGGLPVGLWSAGMATLVPGFEAIARRVELDRSLEGAALVLTGEGRIDEQTAMGKTIGRLLEYTRARKIPLWAFGGQVTPEAEVWRPPGLALISVLDSSMTLDEAMREAPTLIAAAVERSARGALYASGPGSSMGSVSD